MGLMLFFNCVTEVPAFHFQSVILDKLPVPMVFNGRMLLLALRLAGYGFLLLLHSPWPVLALELLHGERFTSLFNLPYDAKLACLYVCMAVRCAFGNAVGCSGACLSQQQWWGHGMP
jgi:hypothetical protein